MRGANTYEEHKEIELRRGYVWMGKFGLGSAPWMVEHANRQIAQGVTTYIFLMSGGCIRYRGTVEEVQGGGYWACVSSPEPANTPLYYRAEGCSVWFKVTRLNSALDTPLSELGLFHEPYLPPKPQGMRGLVYVTDRVRRVSAR